MKKQNCSVSYLRNLKPPIKHIEEEVLRQRGFSVRYDVDVGYRGEGMDFLAVLMELNSNMRNFSCIGGVARTGLGRVRQIRRRSVLLQRPVERDTYQRGCEGADGKVYLADGVPANRRG